MNLAEVLDRASGELFLGNEITSELDIELRDWIRLRMVKTGKNTGMLTLSAPEYAAGIRLFTGEKLNTKLAARNVLTSEAARILSVTGKEPELLTQMRTWLSGQCFAGGCVVGECAHSAMAHMRFAAADNSDVTCHLASLRNARDGKGRWKGFPYIYTLLALSEISSTEVGEELGYAKRFLANPKASTLPEKYFGRRELLIGRLIK